jgi:hypothetical protein
LNLTLLKRYKRPYEMAYADRVGLIKSSAAS